ncbi:hypothetical protein PYW07_005890 [Mythimna separata]|uniref:Uncharacterized protein n=2 Tax=Mythimna separata TaxID=271217 RepID=A0AAD8DSI4_MYTSE|nr:hypothetical protein PYW07_005890 [Mythimna separata]
MYYSLKNSLITMKLLIVLALVAAALARPDDSHYDEKYDNFNIDEVITNERLLKNYAHCLIGDGKCTPEGNEFKKLLPEATKSNCGKCTDKQKVHVAKAIKAIKEKLPTEYETLRSQIDPEGAHAEDINKYVAKYAP